MSYTRELVERLLPALWDREFVYSGLENPCRPDPDMPKVKANPKTGNTIYAYLADIHTGWRMAPLRSVERKALYLRFGLDMKQAHVGQMLSIRRQSATEHIDAGVGRITDYLNGGMADSGDPDSAEQ